MAYLPAISALSSLSEKDLYYQYLINNNSTSTMLNAISGNNQDSSYDGLGLSGLMGTGGLYGMQGLSSLIGTSLGISGDGLNSLGMASSFSSILKLYLNAETSEAGNMAQKLSDALEEAREAGEEQTGSYKTVQEIYQYFTDKSSLAAQALNNKDTSSGTAEAESITSTAEAQTASYPFKEFDFDSYINNIERNLIKK